MSSSLDAAPKTPTLLISYLTEAGKALADRTLRVTVTETGPRDDTGRPASTISACQACKATDKQYWETVTYSYTDKPIHHTVTEAAKAAEGAARKWAKNHAKNCSALPA